MRKLEWSGRILLKEDTNRCHVIVILLTTQCGDCLSLRREEFSHQPSDMNMKTCNKVFNLDVIHIIMRNHYRISLSLFLDRIKPATPLYEKLASVDKCIRLEWHAVVCLPSALFCVPSENYWTKLRAFLYREISIQPHHKLVHRFPPINLKDFLQLQAEKMQIVARYFPALTTTSSFSMSS